jgi:hypothetical protein
MTQHGDPASQRHRAPAPGADAVSGHAPHTLALPTRCRRSAASHLASFGREAGLRIVGSCDPIRLFAGARTDACSATNAIMS